jgi:hypothetical protein
MSLSTSEVGYMAVCYAIGRALVNTEVDQMPDDAHMTAGELFERIMHRKPSQEEMDHSAAWATAALTEMERRSSSPGRYGQLN